MSLLKGAVSSIVSYKERTLRDSWGGECFYKPSFGFCDSYRAQLMTTVIPSFTPSGALGALIKDMMRKQPFICWV